MKDDSEADVKPLEEMADIATQRTQVEQIRQSIEAAALQLAESTDFPQTVTRVLAQISKAGLSFGTLSVYLIDRSANRATHYFLHPSPVGWESISLDEVPVERRVHATHQPEMGMDSAVGQPTCRLAVPSALGVLSISDAREHDFSAHERDLLAYLVHPLETLVVRHRDLHALDMTQAKVAQSDEELVALHDGSYDLSGKEPDEITRLIIELSTNRLPFDRAGIFLLNPEGDLLRGTWGVDDEGAIVPIPDTVFPLNPVRAEDISEAAQVARGELEYFLTQDLDKERRSSIEGNIQASLTVPMRAGERVIGVLVADNYFSSRPIGKEQVQSLRILANQGAAALENARLYQVLQTAHGELEKRIAQRTLELSMANEELITRHRDLSLLMNTSQIASETLDLQTVLNQIADALQRHLDCDIVEIYTVDQDRYQVQLWSYRELWVDDTREQASFSIGEGLSGWVAAHRESIRIGRPDDDRRGISNSAPVKAFLGVPVNFEDQILGVLSVSRFDDDQFDEPMYRSLFTEEDEERLQAVADSVATCIHNAQVYTELRQTEENLRESEEKFRSFMETASDLMHITDRNGDFIYVNEAMAGVLRYSKEELLGMHISQILDDEDWSVFERKSEQLASKEGIILEPTWIAQDGRRIQGEMRVVAVYDRSGNFSGTRGVFRDITERKLLEEQLRIRQMMDSLGTLAGGIAHDFNNILTGIMGNLGLLEMRETELDQTSQKHLRDIEQGCMRAADLIQQFVKLSKEPGDKKTTVDLFYLVDEVLSLVVETTDRFIEKHNAIEPKRHYILAETSQLHQVFLNLTTNAVQAIQERGLKPGDNIRISATGYAVTSQDPLPLPEGEYVRVSIADTGVGMSDDIRGKIFDPYFTTKDPSSGNGLGLAMVYNIITKQHDGHIEVESEQGEGATFHLYLPKAPMSTDEEQSGAVRMLPGSGTILVVDDEKLIRETTQRALETFGYTVMATADGRQGLDIYIANKDTIDAVILDLTMPKMTGQMMFQQLLELSPEVKVIISTGHLEPDEDQGILSQAKGFLAKPYTIKKLVQTVKTVLAS